MVEHIKEVNNTGFGQMYQFLFLPKGTGTDWRSAFRQQEELFKKVGSNVILPEISNSPSKGNQLVEIGTMLNNVKNDQEHIRKNSNKTRKLKYKYTYCLIVSVQESGLRNNR